jgi:hypothetical protein
MAARLLGATQGPDAVTGDGVEVAVLIYAHRL